MGFDIPRPRGRGPVEATIATVKHTTGKGSFRARAGAAPLKLDGV